MGDMIATGHFFVGIKPYHCGYRLQSGSYQVSHILLLYKIDFCLVRYRVRLGYQTLYWQVPDTIMLYKYLPCTSTRAQA